VLRCTSPACRHLGLILLSLAVTAAPTLAQDGLLAPILTPDPTAMMASHARTAADVRDWIGPRPWRKWGAVTGDWGAIRSWLDR
jgi:hypothetical protein